MRTLGNHEYAESLEELLRLKSDPIAIKLLEREENIPKEAQRPRVNYGYRLLTCQAFSEARRSGTTIVQTKEEMWCFEPALGYGFIELNEYFLEGNTRYPAGLVSTWEAAKAWAQAFPRIEYGKFLAILMAPLSKANFEPDLVLIYANTAQITQLLMGRTWKDGRDITCRISGQAACVYAVVLPLLTGECYLTIPCLGDRKRAFCQDDESIFTVPIEKMGDVITGLRALKQGNYGLPTAPTMAPEVLMSEPYMNMAKMTGMLK